MPVSIFSNLLPNLYNDGHFENYAIARTSMLSLCRLCNFLGDRLKSLDMFPLTFWHEYLDMFFFSFLFKIIHGLLSADHQLFLKLSSRQRPTRSSSSGVTKNLSSLNATQQLIKTVLYQQMHTRLERCC